MRHTFVVLGVLGAAGAWSQSFPEITGKVLFGYQGWHACPGDQKGTGWTHWTRGGAPAVDNLVVDMYPDLSEFGADELCPAAGFTVGGRTAAFFSARHPKSVDRHFRWMKEYGLDGVLVQRFLTEAAGKRSGGDVVLRNAMAGALAHGRAFAVEYDLSGAGDADLLERLQADWAYLVDEVKVTRHPGYLRHKGRPVLSVWGMGFNDGNHPPASPAAAAALVKWFREDAGEGYRVAFLGGVPSGWRTRDADAYPDAAWAAVYDSLDIVQPWTVGRYVDSAGADRWRAQRLDGDAARTSQRGRAYQAVIWPGFSWKNLNAGPANQIPRRGGAFLWRQAVNARRAGAPMLKIAMFDEVDESTAMYKLAARRADAPDQGYWLTLDADGLELPSDWYLRVANAVTRMFRGEIPASEALPIRPGDPPAAIRPRAGSAAPGLGAGLRAVRAEGGVRFSAAEDAARGGRSADGARSAGYRAVAALRILDPRGRLLRRLPAAAGAAVWDGLDAAGRRPGIGVYQAVAVDDGGRPLARAVFAWTGG